MTVRVQTLQFHKIHIEWLLIDLPMKLPHLFFRDLEGLKAQLTQFIIGKIMMGLFSIFIANKLLDK